MFVVVVIAVGLLIASPVSAQHLGQTDLPVLRYEVQPSSDGDFDLIPIPEDNSVDDIIPPTVEIEESEIIELLGNASIREIDILEDQPWYVHVTGDGQFLGYYTIPRSGALPAAIIETGDRLQRIEPPSVLRRVLPSGEQVRAIVQMLQETVREAVCDMPARPERFGSEVDISAGIGITGRIAFNVEWETASLCG